MTSLENADSRFQKYHACRQSHFFTRFLAQNFSKFSFEKCSTSESLLCLAVRALTHLSTVFSWTDMTITLGKKTQSTQFDTGVSQVELLLPSPSLTSDVLL